MDSNFSPVSFQVSGDQTYARLLKNGQNVSLYVRSVNADGTLRIQVAGADVIARSEMPAGFSVSAGSVLKGTVFFEDGKVYIKLLPNQPVQNFPLSSFLASSGLPPSPAAVFTAAFFYASGKRLVPAEIARITALAASFPGREMHACEAASILSQKGIPLTKETLACALSVLEGRNAAPAQGDAGFLDDVLDGGGSGGRPSANDSSGGDGGRGRGDSAEEAAAGKPEAKEASAENADASGGAGASVADSAEIRRGEALRDFYGRFTGAPDTDGGSESPAWHVFPYRREFAGKLCTGSLRVLVDRSAGKTLEARLTLMDGDASADFVLGGGTCRFEVFPRLSASAMKKNADDLKAMLAASGLDTAVLCGLVADTPLAASVDIEV